jgi:hypothetical protein
MKRIDEFESNLEVLREDRENGRIIGDDILILIAQILLELLRKKVDWASEFLKGEKG